MWKFRCTVLMFFCIGGAWAGELDVRVADLDEEVQNLRQECGQLRLEVEELTREREGDRARYEKLQEDLKRVEGQMREQQVRYTAELTKRLTMLSKEMQGAVNEVTDKVNQELSKVKKPAAAAVVFKDDYPREGVSYTVKPGDTLSVIAMKLKSTTRDIQNANRIADPRTVRVGQVLFIPQRSS